MIFSALRLSKLLKVCPGAGRPCTHLRGLQSMVEGLEYNLKSNRYVHPNKHLRLTTPKQNSWSPPSNFSPLPQASESQEQHLHSP